MLILTHRRNLVDQFHGELRERGYGDRIAAPLLAGKDNPKGPVTVETYQWFVRNAGQVSDAYTIVICDEAHTALGEKTSASIRRWDGPVFVGMTATGALIARHVTDLFPTQTSRFDLAQAARRGVISPLRCIRIPPGPGVRTIAKVPLRRGEVDTEFDQDMLAELLDQLPFNLAIADLYRTRFNGVPGVVYTAGVRHAYNVAQAFRDVGLKAQAVSGETPKRELARILAEYERGTIDVLVNAQLLAEGWNSPRATVCMHLAPTASKRIYQQRVGRVTRRHPGKEAGIVIDFVHPATKHDDPVVTLHSLLDRDVYRGGAIVVGPVRRGRGRRVRVERRVLPVTPDPDRRAEVFERELWRIAVEHLDYAEQHVWAALAGARVAPNGWRRAKAMLHFDRQGELKRRFLITAVERNRNAQLRLRALQEIAAARDAEAFDEAIDLMATWPRDERREGVKIMLQALAEKRIGRRDQANAWIWRMAEYTREVHEEYAVQRWPETKRLLGLLVNSSGGAHARNARRLVHAARRQDRRLGRRAARRRAGAHAGGRGGAARRAHAHGAQAERAGARAAAELPERPARARLAPPPQGREGGRRRRGRRRGGRSGGSRRGPGPGRRRARRRPVAGGRRGGVRRGARRRGSSGRRRRCPTRSARRSRRRRRGARARRRGGAGATETQARIRAQTRTRVAGERRRRRDGADTEAAPTAPTRRPRSSCADEKQTRPAQTQSGRESGGRRARRRVARGSVVSRPTAPEVHLAGVEQQLLAARVAGTHAQATVVGDAERACRARRSTRSPARRARRARGRRPSPARASPRASARGASSSSASAGSTCGGSHPSDVAISRSSGGNASSSTRDVEADPEHDPALLRAALGEDPATLRPSSSTSLGHLIAAPRPALSK